MNNFEKIEKIIPLWYAQRKWAEEMLIQAFQFEKAEDILLSQYRGSHSIPGTSWMYRTHGVGVDIFRPSGAGGIDFDFNKPHPDKWRLRVFFEKQYEEGNLPFTEYNDLYKDEELLELAIKQVLEKVSI